MSVFFLVTPVLAGMAWPVLSAAITTTLGAAGYNLVRSRMNLDQNLGGLDSVEMDLKNSEGLSDTLGEEEKLVLERDGVTLTFRKGEGGCCKLHVSGRGKTHEELARAGQEASNKIVQAYAYSKVMAEAKKRGLKVVEEQNEDGKIRLRFRKWN
jgi:hypothetical protein